MIISLIFTCSLLQRSISLLGWRWVWWEDQLVASVKTPGNAVEFEVDYLNLTGTVDGEQVETLDLVLC